MKSYEEYKDTGIEWIGEIPEHWEKIKVKYYSQVINGSTPKSNVADYWNGEIVWLTPDDVGKNEGKLIKDSQRKISVEGLNSCGTSITPPKSIVLSTRAPIGHIGITTLETCTNQGCKTIVPINNIVNSIYVYYHILSKKDILQSLGQGATFTELSSQKLRDFITSLPHLEEQTQIAKYLDYKTPLIDKLIEKNEELIQLLEEKRSAIINHAVTKGLNPDVKMKDSGIEWIGEIPEHWEVKRLKYITHDIGDGIHTTPKYVDESEYFFINGNNLVNGKIEIYDSTKSINEQEYIKHKKDLNQQTLLLSINGTIGNLALYKNEKVILGKSAAYIMCQKSISIKYLYYLFQGSFVQNYFNTQLTGTTISNLGLYSIKNTPTIIPCTIIEQNAIVDYLDSKTSQIDKLIEEKRKTNEYLKEYRTTLISNVVTGKIDVRDEVVPDTIN